MSGKGTKTRGRAKV
uniref:Uncharacterized protein n=1 Tax=Arundo donax TaxID=35708 RepID=A0A0A8ZPN6_ARUDO